MRIPTKLYIYVPRRSARGIFRSNIWANLTRADTNEGIGGKKLLSFLDGNHVSTLYTEPKTGYAGPFDINPRTEGLHTTWIEFPGDEKFEPCKSQTVILKIDPNLLDVYLLMNVASTEVTVGEPLEITGTVKAVKHDGAIIPLEYKIPLDLMVFDPTSTQRLKPVLRFYAKDDFKISYKFQKAGIYRIFINFLGDDKYASAWSNNGRTTQIVVKGGELPMSFEKTVTITMKEKIKIKWIRSDTEPAPPEGYERLPELDLDFGVLGKYWAFLEVAE